MSNNIIHAPALIAEYQLQLPDKKLLQAKLHGLCVDAEATDEQ